MKCKNNRKKGSWKIHVTVNVKTKKILSIKATDEHVHDSEALFELVDKIVEPDKQITIGNLFADGGSYDDNNILRYLGDNGILPCIKVRRRMLNQMKKRRNILRNPSVLAQKKDSQKWKEDS